MSPTSRSSHETASPHHSRRRVRKLRDHATKTPSNLDILELHTREVLKRLEMSPWEEASIKLGARKNKPKYICWKENSLRCVRIQTRTLSYEIWIDCFRVYVKCELLWAKEVLLKAGYFPLLMFCCPWNQFWGTNIREHVLHPGFVVAVSSPASGLSESIGISPKET